MQFAAPYLLVLRLLISPWTMPFVTEAVKAAEVVPVSPLSISIPTINLTSEVVSVGLTDELLTEVPEKVAGWHNLGPKPGEYGSAVIVGHTPGIFSHISSLQPGDKIVVTDTQNHQLNYRITKLVWYPTDKFPVETVYASVGGYFLNLITCAGDERRLVVFSELE
jgi:sortase A